MPESLEHIEKLIGQGRHIEARNLALDGLKASDNLRLSQIYAMATSKSGAPMAAMEFLEPVYQRNTEDSETAGILGGIYKELFKKDQSTKYALLSRDTYIKNFIVTRNYYTGINAATMSAIAGQMSKGREIAGEVIRLIENSASTFWELATLGEAYLLTKNREKSTECYFKARKLAGTDWGKINSVHNQLWLLNHYVPVPGEVMKVFSPPGVVAFVGHMIDHPTRKTPRFPPSLEGRTKESIASAIKTMNAKIGYTALACGSDILFAEAMIESGGEISVWMPFSKADFIETSVRFAGEQWEARFERLINQFPVNYITHETYGGHDDLFSFQSTVIFGSAILRSTMNHTKPNLLTVLSETDLHQKEGGTRDMIARWPFPERHVNINPDDFLTGKELPTQPSSRQTALFAKTTDRPVQYIVYADFPDTVGGLSDEVWKTAQEKMDEMVIRPTTLNLENRILASYNNVAGAMELARHIIDSADLAGCSLKLRISLYGSPAFLEADEREGQKRLAERSINRLNGFHHQMRPGALYALARCASVLALDINQYSLDYAGLIIPEAEKEYFDIYSVAFKKS